MSLLADAESPKPAFESVELKENNENGKIAEGKDKPGEKCRRLFCENKILVFLICLIMLSIILGIAIGFALAKARKEPVVTAIPTNYRLPGNLIPQHYVLEVQPYIIPDHLTFEGKVEISVRCVEETDKVILHSKDLTINEEDIRIRNVYTNYNTKVDKVEYNKTMSFLILHLAENLKEHSEYLVFLSFKGKLQRSGKGFYVSTYYDENNKVHYVASTQYEAIHAREGFPCFDEPAFKATFEVTIVRWKNMTSLSNMPRIKTERRGKDWVADVFLTSLKMSSYTLAYYVGEYVGKVENKVRVWAPKHKEDFVDFSLNLANKLLPYFEDLLKVPFAPPKVDMIPVTDLVAAAMENWGLIIYVDNQLLYNKERQNAETKQLIASTVAHELAHQWFGNLVTPIWWSDIWLSEGMTTYLENIASTHFFPKWNEIDKALKSYYDTMIEKDCLDDNPLTVWRNLTADKITLPVPTFGTVTYIKGAMMGRMMHYMLGNETFWRAISGYLHEYSYRNVEEKDMWQYLTKAQTGKNKIDLEKVMRTWTHTSGIPIVTVTRDYNSRTATFSQHSCKDMNIPRYSSDLWHVPISYTTSRSHEWNPGIQTWLTEKQATLKDMPKDDEWMLLNGQSVGCYLVNYDKRNWELLAKQLRRNHEVFSVDQRYKLLADANILYKFGNLSLDVLIDVSSYLGKERILSIFSYPNFNFIEDNRDMEYSSYDEYWTEFVISIMAPIQYALGWESNLAEELRLMRKLRSEANRMLCEMDYLPCVEEAVKMSYAFIYNQTAISTYIREYIFCAAVRSGPNDITEYFLNNIEATERLNYLACSENETVINYLFDIFDKGWNAVIYSPASQIMRNRKYWRTFLEFLDRHLTSKNDNFYSWFSPIQRGATSLEQKKKLVEVINNHIDKLPEDKQRMLEGYLKRTEEKFDEMEAKVKTIGKWLEKRLWKD